MNVKRLIRQAQNRGLEVDKLSIVQFNAGVSFRLQYSLRVEFSMKIGGLGLCAQQ